MIEIIGANDIAEFLIIELQINASLHKSFEEMATSEPLSFMVKREIVQRLAAFEGLTEVAKAIKADYGIELTPQRIQYYDPTKKAGAALAEDLKTLFFETRKASLVDLDGIRIFHKANQLRALDRALDLAEKQRHIAMVISLVEAAAKIAGTIVSKHEHTGKDGKDLTPPPRPVIIIPDNGRDPSLPETTDMRDLSAHEASRVYHQMVTGQLDILTESQYTAILEKVIDEF